MPRLGKPGARGPLKRTPGILDDAAGESPDGRSATDFACSADNLGPDWRLDLGLAFWCGGALPLFSPVSSAPSTSTSSLLRNEARISSGLRLEVPAVSLPCEFNNYLHPVVPIFHTYLFTDIPMYIYMYCTHPHSNHM